jgi:hypothetical protein
MRIILEKNANATMFHKVANSNVTLEADNFEEMQRLMDLVKKNLDLSIHV